MSDGTHNATTEDVLAAVREMIVEVVGDDIEMLGPIDLDTSFNNDLELESIELVALAEKVQGKYGDKFNFADWTSKKSLDEIIALTVGDLVTYIVESIT